MIARAHRDTAAFAQVADGGSGGAVARWPLDGGYRRRNAVPEAA